MAKKKFRCKGEIKYTSPIKLTEDTWACAPKKKKEELLKALNLDKSWAKTKSMKEMVRRGGGLPAKSILNLSKLYLGKKGGEVTINWK